MERLLNYEELAEILNVSPYWVRANSRPGNPKLPTIRVGNHVRFNLDEVLASLKHESSPDSSNTEPTSQST